MIVFDFLVFCQVLYDFPAKNTTCWPKLNLFGIWQIQFLEQVLLVSVPTLPAYETINFQFIEKTGHLHVTLDSQLVFDDCVNKQIAFLKRV